MPPPGTYIDIDTLPFSRTVTQAEFNGGTFGGTANAVWFRRVAAADEILGMYTNAGGTFVPVTSLYASDGTTLHKQIFSATGWWRLLAAGTYYLRITRSPSGGSDFDFTVTAEQGEILSDVPIGSILINDDSVVGEGGPFAGDPFPATVWTQDGTFLGFVRDIQAGEIGDSLPNGVTLINSNVTGEPPLTLYSAGLGSPSIVTVPGVTIGTNPIANDGTQFFILDRPANDLYTISDTGVVSAALLTLTGDVIAIGVSRDGATLYYTMEFDPVIYRHDIASDTPLANLYTSAYEYPNIGMTPNGHPGEILVLPDGSIVTYYLEQFADYKAGLLHLSADGALLNTVEWEATLESYTAVDHMHYAADGGSAAVNLWLYLDPSGNTGRIGRFVLATGTFSESFEPALFTEGVNRAETADIFGPSQSCFMFTVGFVEDEEDEIDPPPMDTSTPCPCPGGPGGGLDTIPDPIGPLPPWVAMCEGGCGVDSVPDVAVGEVWL